MEFILHYKLYGSVHVDAVSQEKAESIMRANMVNEIYEGVDLDSLEVYGIEIER